MEPSADKQRAAAALVPELLRRVRSRVLEPWRPVLDDPDAFLRAAFGLAREEHTDAVQLLSCVYECLDCAPLRRAALRLVSVPLWAPGRVPEPLVDAAVRGNPRPAGMRAAAARRFGAVAEGASSERDALHGLVCAFLRVLERARAQEAGERMASREIRRDSFTVSGCMARIQRRLNRGTFAFSELFDEDMTRAELITMFMALLEMVKLGRVAVKQEHAYEEIYLSQHAPAPPTPREEQE